MLQTFIRMKISRNKFLEHRKAKQEIDEPSEASVADTSPRSDTLSGVRRVMGKYMSQKPSPPVPTFSPPPKVQSPELQTWKPPKVVLSSSTSSTSFSTSSPSTFSPDSPKKKATTFSRATGKGITSATQSPPTAQAKDFFATVGRSALRSGSTRKKERVSFHEKDDHIFFEEQYSPTTRNPPEFMKGLAVATALGSLGMGVGHRQSGSLPGDESRMAQLDAIENLLRREAKKKEETPSPSPLTSFHLKSEKKEFVEAEEFEEKDVEEEEEEEGFSFLKFFSRRKRRGLFVCDSPKIRQSHQRKVAEQKLRELSSVSQTFPVSLSGAPQSVQHKLHVDKDLNWSGSLPSAIFELVEKIGQGYLNVFQLTSLDPLELFGGYDRHGSE